MWPESCRPVTSPLPKCLRVPWAWLPPYMPQQMLVIHLQTRTPACFLRHFDQNVVNWAFRYSWIGGSLRNWAFWFPSVITGPLWGEHPPVEKGPGVRNFSVFLCIGLNKLLNKQSISRWSETPWRLCDVYVMPWLVYRWVSARKT